MTEQEKRKYNKEHYLKNRSVILEKAKSKYQSKNPSVLKVIPLFKAESQQLDRPKPPKKRPGRLRWGTLFLIALTLANTYFLVTETARFYADFDGSWLPAYLKALILEGSVFALTSLIRAKTSFAGILHKSVIALIYSYSIWAISGSVIQNAYQKQAQISQNQKIVTELELEIAKKIALRDSYFQANRVTLASKIDHVLDLLKQKVEQSRNFLAQSPNSLLVWNTLLTLMLFRVLVVISNLFCLKELRRRYRLKLHTI
jgi:hypothetical protein